jgi:hypothetical protein
MSDAVGTVTALWRFPVKSMLGEPLDAVEVTDGGLTGDRAYALVDTASGKVLSAKHPKLGRILLQCRASFVDPPGRGEVPPVHITLPDGTTVTSGGGDVDATLSRALGHGVTLARAAPADFTIEHYHPDLDGLDPEGHRDTTTESTLGAAFWNQLGLPSAVPAGAFFDLFPVSVMTTSTLAHLETLAPATRFDARRFRMNVIVETSGDGFVENEWPGHELHLGDTVRLQGTMPDPRCVMTTRAQDDLDDDLDVLRTLVRHNRLEVAGAGQFPCAGLYTVVTAGGTIRAGDKVVLS